MMARRRSSPEGPVLRSLLVLSLAVSAVSAASAAEPPRPMSPQDVPESLQPAVAKAEAAMDVLRDRIFKKHAEAIAQGGTRGALEACSGEAQRIAKEVAQDQKVEIGRTSFHIRNPLNAPRPWAAAWVAAGEGKTASEAKPAVFDLGDRVGVLRPIPVAPLCTRCHGREEGIEPEIKAEISRKYPKDEATGFVPGDLRGFMWAEVKKR
jgi:hypothetical protein